MTSRPAVASVVDSLNTALDRWLPKHIALFHYVDEYYTHKAKTKSLIDAIDLAIVTELTKRAVLRNRPSPRIVEAGAGFGQLSLLISAVLGWETYPYEMAESRHAGCLFLKKALGSLTDLCQPVFRPYPRGDYQSDDADILISTNVINDVWYKLAATEAARWRYFLQDIPEAFIDVERAGSHRQSSTSQQEAINICERLGYSVQPVIIDSLGSSCLCHMVKGS